MTTDGPIRAASLSAELERIEALINTPSKRDPSANTSPPVAGVRPLNASTLVIVQNQGRDLRVLMGKRHHSLKFMPGALVFPGGRVDASDATAPASEELPAETTRLIVAHMRGRKTARGARALGMAALRELAEESGLLIGDANNGIAAPHGWPGYGERQITPSLAGLALLARAITPPGLPRRFDTWFFVTTADRIAHTPQGGFSPSGELEELQWIRPQEALQAQTREITRVMLVELMHRLERDPGLDPAHGAPCYRTVNRRFQKSEMA